MANAFQQAVGARIRALRESAGLTQREFADLAALNPAFAGRVERGLQNLTLSAIGRIAFTLNVPVEALFEGIAPGSEVLDVKPRSNARRSATGRPTAAGAPAAPATGVPMPKAGGVGRRRRAKPRETSE